jgi:hypothetical protein
VGSLESHRPSKVNLVAKLPNAEGIHGGSDQKPLTVSVCYTLYLPTALTSSCISNSIPCEDDRANRLSLAEHSDVVVPAPPYEGCSFTCRR